MMQIEFRLNEEKAVQAAAFLLLRSDGCMTHRRLLKLLYMADRRSLELYGFPVVGDRYVSMDKGPVLSELYDRIKAARRHEPSVWATFIEPARERHVSIAKVPPSDLLSPADEEILSRVFAEFGMMPEDELIELLHRLPEWINPNGSSHVIEPETILRAVGHDDTAIAVTLGILESRA